MKARTGVHVTPLCGRAAPAGAAPRLLACAVAVIAVLSSTVDVGAQQALLRTSTQGFTFGDPTAVGLRSYRLVATRLSTSVPVRRWVILGATAELASGSLSSRGVSSVDLSGLTDAEVFADFEAGPFLLRGVLALGSGGTALDADRLVVASLAAAEFLPFPVRSWGRGGGYAAEVRLPLRSGGFDVEVLGAVRRFNAYAPLDDDPMEYRLGSETRFGLTVARSPTALSRVEAGGWMVFPAPDVVGSRDVFEPGRRVAVYGVVAFPVGPASALVRADLYRRGPGDDVSGAPEPDPVILTSVLGGGTDPVARDLFALALETRTVGRLPLITSLRGRMVRERETGAKGWLASAGLGTEYEPEAPWPGRTFVMPEGRIHRGRVTIAPGYESTAVAWELSLAVRWEARR